MTRRDAQRCTELDAVPPLSAMQQRVTIFEGLAPIGESSDLKAWARTSPLGDLALLRHTNSRNGAGSTGQALCKMAARRYIIGAPPTQRGHNDCS